MSKKVNEKFVNAYMELDRCCCEKFGISAGGITEYVNRLGNAKFAPKRDEVLPKLVKYRNIRNIFAHEPKALKKNDEIGKADIVWVQKFTKILAKQKDPYSVYLKKARKYARTRKLRRTLLVVFLLLLAAAAAAAAYFFLSGGMI